jgi:hypothetical protein
MTSWKLCYAEVALLLEDSPLSIPRDGEKVYRVAFVLIVAVSRLPVKGLNIRINTEFTYVNIYVRLCHRHS